MNRNMHPVKKEAKHDAEKFGLHHEMTGMEDSRAGNKDSFTQPGQTRQIRMICEKPESGSVCTGRTATTEGT